MALLIQAKCTWIGTRAVTLPVPGARRLGGLEHLFRNLQLKRHRKKLKSRDVRGFLAMVSATLWAVTPVTFHVLMSAIMERAKTAWEASELEACFTKEYLKFSRVPAEQAAVAGLDNVLGASWVSPVVPRSWECFSEDNLPDVKYTGHSLGDAC